ncbi:MAG: hypothetical protein WA821_16500 [Anaerolineales bacterium]
MTIQSMEAILKQAARLSAAERLQIASRLIEEVRREIPVKKGKSLKWRDLSGALPYPALGEDAQAYITRTRQEETDQRHGA